jgi:cell wall-associated NlpC family hydrolase
MLAFLPARPVQTESLAQDYCRGLRFFRGVRYVWGGEGLLGVDCSGLVRQGLIWGQVRHGLRELNDQPIRNAMWLWWNDCSAQDLRDGFAGLTRECFRAESILEADHAQLQPGDLAVTASGVHVMAYLGNRTWIEADPGSHKVIEIALPTANTWFRLPVVFVIWECLDKERSGPQCNKIQ